MKTIFLLLAIAIIPTTALAMDLKKGNYLGKTDQGRPCELYIRDTMSGNAMEGYSLRTPIAYTRIYIADDDYKNGQFSGGGIVMRDGFAGGRPYYRPMSGAPIFARAYMVTYVLQHKGVYPTAIRQVRTPYQYSMQSMAGGSRGTTETCKNLRPAN